ncbi:hypothetical protein [Cognatishimia sp. MH4019]|uniref:hypothetical protein n=1 Tax=Cognatishimia sp. MH4019 TaxID=2854030 RepID=UPI001CD73DFF|nr:hypothetical protein [Cognatishimia sp. MH4019]
MDLSMIDRKNLLADSYAIDGISAPECRSIFLDWALSLPAGVDPKAAIDVALGAYEAAYPEHPMTVTLREGLLEARAPKRRGGRAARVPD